ncbi:adenosylcobinamide amidohydrolase [Rhodovulum imhoffii]|nr:adenosylcobinamide amidohydrolase [Rhodovulum imhoffii]MBK5934186.1 hypothetical protein [Rhodovulum imhoffii]
MTDLRLTLSPPWLEADLGAPHRVLSWASHRPGFVTARRVLWREVRNADLTLDLDVGTWLRAQLAARDAKDAVTMLTSRCLEGHVRRFAQVGRARAECIATVGLSNAERIGSRLGVGQGWGTINLLVHLSPGLTETALIEAVSIAAQARTTAILDAGIVLPTGQATGTGTDCIVLAALSGDMEFCGLHTEIGEALGRAVYESVAQGAADWLANPYAEKAPTSRQAPKAMGVCQGSGSPST